MTISMKRKLSLILSAALCAMPLCACSTKDDISTPPTLDPNESDPDSGITSQQMSNLSEPEPTAVEGSVTGAPISHFSSELFRACSESEPSENTLVSPLSVYTALAMVNNGAVDDTQAEITDVLSGYIHRSGAIVDYADHAPLSLEQINSNITSLMKSINNSDSMQIANSVYVIDRDDVTMNDEFIKMAEKNYFAEIFHEKFTPTTFETINKWVSDKTKNMIPNILSPDSLTPQTVSVLLNAIAFEGEWLEAYESYDITQQEFNNYDGSTVTADFLRGEESTYFEDEYCTGFSKQYKPETNDGQYSFVAILPNEDITIDEYIEDHLNGDTIKQLLESSGGDVVTLMPKFTFDKDYKLPDTLKSMGINKAFSPYEANFTDLAAASDGNVISIADVIHKTHIELDENGTKAAAATAIIMEKNDAIAMTEYVTLDRPFVFAIYDEVNELPVFMGKLCVLE